LITGCAVGPDFVRPNCGLDDATLASDTDFNINITTSPATVPEQWWELFNDPLLADFVAQAHTSNLDLQLAMTRIEQGRAQLGIATSELLPNLGGGGSYTRERISQDGHWAGVGAPPGPNHYWQIGFDSSWEIDLWGRARRAREGALAAMEATKYDHEAIRVSISAEVARTYLQLRGIQAQLAIVAQNLETAEYALRIAESREKNGVATRYETTSARAQLATVEALLPELTQRRNTLMNTLAFLLGERPRALDTKLRTVMPLPSLPSEVPIGIPSELARRRPDILSAEAQLHAATAVIGVAKADFYPRIRLTGQLGEEAFQSADLKNLHSSFYSIGPTVYLPIFHGGLLVQRLALSEARQKAAALTYQRTVLHAWHEVDNALDAWAAQLRAHEELLVAYEQNKQALRVAERNYSEGSADYLSVLIAQRNVLTSQASLNASATQGTLTLVNLYKALGGGWNPTNISALQVTSTAITSKAQADAAGTPMPTEQQEARQ